MHRENIPNIFVVHCTNVRKRVLIKNRIKKVVMHY